MLLFSQSKKSKKQKPLDSIVENYVQDKGLITSYYKEDEKLYLAIADSLLHKDFLMITRIVQLPNKYSGYINAGSKTSEQVVRMVKKGKNILFKEMSFTNTADKNDPINLSVTLNNFSPIIASFPILNKEERVFLIDVTDYFTNDSPGFNIVRKNEKKNFKIGSIDKKRSFIDSVKSFSENIEVLHTLTFNVQNPPRAFKSNSFSFQVNHSLIKLPDNKMEVRYKDPRIGWFSIEKIDYSSSALKADDFKIIRRWRLEPSDVMAYERGELVSPKKPIVYYLDPATPLKWRPYFKQGIEDWNTAFEKAGFKNAIIAKDPPSIEEDPDFSPEDVRYSTVRYVASTTRNAIGPSVSDPRTGEILESDIIWYHNHLRSYRNRYLIETGAANPSARTLNTPDEEIGEMMRRVISHEVGHALGLPHNMKASSAYPVDSLRSSSFTQKMGIATTIMDYARFNYVAQPDDENIRFIRKLGPYDDYAIEWGYRFFSNEKPKEINSILSKWVDEKSLNPMYMFGSRGIDPNSQTENIGDDPVKASAYGIENLKIVAKNLAHWVESDSTDQKDLAELYKELLRAYKRYIYHVHFLIGGVNETLHLNRQKDVVKFKNVSKSKQIEALDFLNTYLWNPPKWLLSPDLVSEVNNKGMFKSFQNTQRSALEQLLSTKKLNRIHSTNLTLKGDSLSVNQLLHDLLTDLFENKNPSNPFITGLQLYYINKIVSLQQDDDLDPSIKANLFGIQNQLFQLVKKKKKKASTKDKAIYQYLLNSVTLE